MRWSLKKSITIIFSVALVLLAIIGTIAYRTTSSLIETNKWVTHTHEVIETLKAVSSQMSDTQASGRGFAITGDYAQLKSYNDVISSVGRDMSRLKELTGDNASQQERIKQLEALVRERINRTDQLIKLRRDQGLEAAQQFISTGEGNRLMEQIRAVISDMEAEERALLDRRAGAVESSTRATLAATVVAGLFSILVLAGVFFLINREVAERRRIESELRETTALQNAVLNGPNYTIISVTPEGVIRTFNAAAERLLGYKAEEVVGISTPEILHDPQEVARRAEQLSKEFGRAIEPGFEVFVAKARLGKPDENQWTYIRKDGSRFPVSLSVTALRDAGGEITGFLGVASDVTERNRFERDLAEARDAALESARMKAEFLANMSHEIRTPMNAIIGMTGLLLDTDLNDDQRDYAETVRSSADSLLAIINDVLDFSKIEAGKLNFETVDFDVRNAVEGAVELLAERAQAKGIEMFSLVYSDVPTALRGDAGRLRQVLVNLVSNAIKFTPRGEVVIRVTKESETGSDALLRFAVTDTGIGISEESQRRLFQAFSQADGSTTRKYGGTGLGLAISKQLVDMMKGEIGVESQTDRGSTFWFTARFEKQSRPMVEPAQGYLEGVRVMIVDDNATNRKLVHHQIISWGMRNGSAESGKLALEIMRREAADGDPYDIVILDMQMPEMDGLTLAREIKSDASIAGTRVVMLTSIGKPRPDDEIRAAGIDACLTKPVKQSRLFDCLADLMAASSEEALAEITIHDYSLVENRSVSKRDNIRILVAEDNAVNQKVALRQLQKLGYMADAVANGAEVLDALARIPYTVVLMDCQMPELDGYEATGRIRERERDSRHTIIIAMTANALEGDREKCLAAGMDDYLSKPIRESDLDAMLERWTKSDDGGAMKDAPDEMDETDSASVLDASVIANLRALQSANEPGFLAEVFDLFIEETPARLASIREAAERKDAATLVRAAHALRGNSATLGVRRMAELCEILERHGRAGQADNVLGIVTVLEEEFSRARRALEAEKRR